MHYVVGMINALQNQTYELLISQKSLNYTKYKIIRVAVVLELPRQVEEEMQVPELTQGWP